MHTHTHTHRQKERGSERGRWSRDEGYVSIVARGVPWVVEKGKEEEEKKEEV